MAVGLPINPGSRVLAATIAAIAPICVIKPSDESVTSSVTLQNDNDLLVALPVINAQYIFRLYLDYEGGTLNASDLKLGWTFPAGVTMQYAVIAQNNAGAINFANSSQTSNPQLGTGGAGVRFYGIFDGSILVSATTGVLQLQWAQHVSSATPTIIHAQSYLALWRIA